MKRRKTFTVMAILIAVLVLGVGYATISNITLNLNGNATVIADADFVVVYDTAHTVGRSTTDQITDNSTTYDVVTGAYQSTTLATMNVTLNKTHTSASACYKIDNNSTTLAANLSANVTQVGSPNTAYFGTITTAFYSDSACETALSGSLAAQDSAYMKVTVPKGTTEPAQNVTGTFSVAITASPAE